MKLRRTPELKYRSLMKLIAVAYAGHGTALSGRRRRQSKLHAAPTVRQQLLPPCLRS